MVPILRGYLEHLQSRPSHSAVTLGLAASAAALMAMFKWVERQQDVDADGARSYARDWINNASLFHTYCISSRGREPVPS